MAPPFRIWSWKALMSIAQRNYREGARTNTNFDCSSLAAIGVD
jgi:hypothetical protein